jgi:hypothetical protein
MCSTEPLLESAIYYCSIGGRLRKCFCNLAKSKTADIAADSSTPANFSCKSSMHFCKLLLNCIRTVNLQIQYCMYIKILCTIYIIIFGHFTL